jgi:hypothetical protein
MSSIGMHMVGSAKVLTGGASEAEAPDSSPETSKECTQELASQVTASSLHQIMKERVSTQSVQSLATSPKSNLVQLAGHSSSLTRPGSIKTQEMSETIIEGGVVPSTGRTFSMEDLSSPFEQQSPSVVKQSHIIHKQPGEASTCLTMEAAGVSLVAGDGVGGGMLPSSPRPSAIMRALFRSRSTAPQDAASPPFLSGEKLDHHAYCNRRGQKEVCCHVFNWTPHHCLSS